MQAQRKTQPYEYFDFTFDGASEVPMDTEYTLPDYCADIQKILKCSVTPELSSYHVSEDMLRCEGTCDVRILYLDPKGDTLRCCDFTKEFTANIAIKSAEEKSVAYVKASVEHMTCRAVSARRVDLHVALSLRALTVVQKQCQITYGMEGEGVERRERMASATQAVNAMSHQFYIEDRLPLKNGKPPIGTLLRKEVHCRSTGCKVSQGQIAVTGRVEISFLYQPAEGGDPERMSSSVDFEQVIACDGAQETCLCDLRVEAGESSLSPREDDVGEYTSVDVRVGVFLTAFLYQTCQISYLDDAYSIRAPLELRYEETPLLDVQEIHSEVLKKKGTLSVEEIQKVVDLWCEQDSVRSRCEKGKLFYRVKFTVCLLYQNVQGRLLYMERPFEYETATEQEGELPQKSDTVFLTDLWEYRIADKNSIEISVETWVSSLLYNRGSIRFLSAVSSDDSAPGFPHTPQLLVYYASAGENLWDIAKNHRALLSDLREQNELYEDVLPDTRPLILCRR